jgi:AbrB family looped-hinge helix DNA binding protein
VGIWRCDAKAIEITSKGQITVPIEVRRLLGVKAGDRLFFETDAKGVRIRPMRNQNVFDKYSGIGNPGIPSGRKAINRWLQGMRGHDD